MKNAYFAALASTFLSFLAAMPANAALVEPSLDSVGVQPAAIAPAAAAQPIALTDPFRLDALLPVISRNPVQMTSERRKSTLPEPSTWALLAAGFGATGIVLRARSRHHA